MDAERAVAAMPVPRGIHAARPVSCTFGWLRVGVATSTAAPGGWVGSSPGTGSRLRSMRNRPFEAVSSDRGLLGMWGMRDRPRSRDSGSNGGLRMLRGAPARMEGRHTHAPGAAVDVATLTLSDPRVHDTARRAWTPCGTAPWTPSAARPQRISVACDPGCGVRPRMPRVRPRARPTGGRSGRPSTAPARAWPASAGTRGSRARGSRTGSPRTRAC